jgi:hypothetical protein
MAVRDITAGACDPYTEGPSAKPRLVQITPIKIRLSASLKSLSRFLASLHGRHGVVSDVAGAGPEQTVVLDVGPAQPTERDRVYTVFRAQDTGFAYVATVQGASVEGAAVRARRLKVQGKTYDPQVEIKKGDLVTSGFFSLIDVGISAVAPTEKRGTNKELVEATPGYLDATVYVGLIEFPPEDVSGGEAPPIAPAGGASPGPTAVPNY